MADDAVTLARPASAPAPQGRAAEVVTPEALSFLAELHRRFGARRLELLAARQIRQARFDAGESPDFLPETKSVRDGDWRVAPIPADLQDRRVEITGPTDRKMVDQRPQFRGARVHGRLRGRQLAHLGEPGRGSGQSDGPLGRQAQLTSTPTSGKSLPAHRQARGADRAAARLAPAGEARHRRRRADERLAVRFRPLFLPQRQGARWPPGTGPYFYLPKMESHLEARLWNDVFVYAAGGARRAARARSRRRC